MDLTGKKVRLKNGKEFIVDKHDNYIYLTVDGQQKRYIFEIAFRNGGLVAVDPSIQQSIIDELADIDKEKAKKLSEANAESVQKNVENNTLAAINKKQFDALFGKDYHVEHLQREPILTYNQVEDLYKIRLTGFGRGINITDKSIILISVIKKEKGYFVYHDRWTEKGDYYIYSGEGKVGDQKFTKGNKAIANANLDGKDIVLFVKFSSTEYFYQGVFQCVEYYLEDDYDANNNIRKEYKFKLKKISD